MFKILLLLLGVLVILLFTAHGWWRQRQRYQAIKRTNQQTIPSTLVTESAEQPAGETPDLEQQTIDDTISKPSEKNIIFLNELIATENAATPADIEPSPSRPEAANQVQPTETKPIEAPIVDEAVVEPELVSLTVMAQNNRCFGGRDTLSALQHCDCHFGEFDIYHRHKYRNGKGPKYFSIASVTAPGTLQPTKVGELSIPGLILFMEKTDPKHDCQSFKQLLATSHELARQLGGVVCDEQRVPLQEVTLKKYASELRL